MPMIDVYAATGTFGDKHRLAVDLATTLMAIEEVPNIPMFRQNTAAFVHDLAADSLSNVGTHLRAVFAKLDVQSRVQLANTLHAQDARVVGPHSR